MILLHNENFLYHVLLKFLNQGLNERYMVTIPCMLDIVF